MEMMTKSAVMMSQTVLTSPPLSAEIELRPAARKCGENRHSARGNDGTGENRGPIHIAAVWIRFDTRWINHQRSPNNERMNRTTTTRPTR